MGKILILMKKYFVSLNGSSYSVSSSIANVLIYNSFTFPSYVQNENIVFVLNKSNVRCFQLTSTASLSHFYVYIFNKKYRVGKHLYLSLNCFVTHANQNRRNREVVVKPLVTHMRLADLFSGTGSAICASKGLPIHPCFSNDSCDNSRKIFEANFLCEFNIDPIETIMAKSVPDHDILIAGFPCQPYSIAGKKSGLSDSRSRVFSDIIRVAKAKAPKFMVLENVKHLKSINNGKILQQFLDLLHSLGYCTKVKILNVSRITDIPQNRERIFIFCFSKKSDLNNFDFEFSE